MPGPILHLGALVMCSHGGTATAASPFLRVTVTGQPVVNVATQYVVVGCTLTGTGTAPCISGQVLLGAARVFAGGVPVGLQAGASIATPTAAPLLPQSVQPRVVAT